MPRKQHLPARSKNANSQLLPWDSGGELAKRAFWKGFKETLQTASRFPSALNSLTAEDVAEYWKPKAGPAYDKVHGALRSFRERLQDGAPAKPQPELKPQWSQAFAQVPRQIVPMMLGSMNQLADIGGQMAREDAFLRAQEEALRRRMEALRQGDQ